MIINIAQNIKAHNQAIWAIKFEPVLTVGNNFFLATGGQDKVVRVWSCVRKYWILTKTR